MPPSSPSLLRQFFSGVKHVFRYWMETEVHVFAFSIAANVLLSFFPFLIVCTSLGNAVFERDVVVSAMDLAFRDFFPSAMGKFMHNNLPFPQPVELLSILILLFSANGPAGDVSIIDLATRKVLKKVKAGDRPWGVITVTQE